MIVSLCIKLILNELQLKQKIMYFANKLFMYFSKNPYSRYKDMYYSSTRVCTQADGRRGCWIDGSDWFRGLSITAFIRERTNQRRLLTPFTPLTCSSRDVFAGL